MKNKIEIRDWILENCINEKGNVDLSNLDFSKFDGNVMITDMKVKRNLHQSFQKVGGALCQGWQEVGDTLHQAGQKVESNLHQDGQTVGGNLSQWRQEVKGYIHIGGDDFFGIKEWDRETKDWKIVKEKNEK